MDITAVITELRSMGNEADRAGMARFGIETTQALGIRVPALRALAKKLGKDAPLSDALWQTGYHEARLLALFIYPLSALTPAHAWSWVQESNSWDLCDQACTRFSDHPAAMQTALSWAAHAATFEKRAAFSLMACNAVHQKKVADAAFLPYLEAIRQAATDERNFVKKAVNWALRQIGKRSMALHGPALELTRELAASSNKTARWIGSDAVRELTAAATLERLRARTQQPQ